MKELKINVRLDNTIDKDYEVVVNVYYGKWLVWQELFEDLETTCLDVVLESTYMVAEEYEEKDLMKLIDNIR